MKLINIVVNNYYNIVCVNNLQINFYTIHNVFMFIYKIFILNI